MDITILYSIAKNINDNNKIIMKQKKWVWSSWVCDWFTLALLKAAVLLNLSLLN